jgi:hypothetical protein
MRLRPPTTSYLDMIRRNDPLRGRRVYAKDAEKLMAIVSGPQRILRDLCGAISAVNRRYLTLIANSRSPYCTGKPLST